MTMITIPVRKAGRSINVDTLKLCGGNESLATQLDTVLAACKSVAYSVSYGLTQSLNDAHAADKIGDSVTPDSIMGTVEKKLLAIYDGSVRAKGKGVVGNPVEREAMKLARKWWKSFGLAAQNAAIGKMREKYESLVNATDEQITDLIVAANAKLPATVEKAKAIVAANNLKVENVEIDIENLMETDESEQLMLEDHSDESDEADEADES